MSSTPKTLIFFAISMLFLFLLSDIMNMGMIRDEAKSGARNGTDSAISRSVEQGILKSRKIIQIDNQQLKNEWLSSLTLNSGAKSSDAKNTALYVVSEHLPFVAAQVGIPYRSRSAGLLNEPDQYIPRHRVIYIWDER